MGRGRIVVAVVAGAVAWAGLWVGGAQVAATLLPGLPAAGQPVMHTGVLLGYLGYSVVLSVLAGWVAAAAATARASIAVRSLAAVQLVLGIGIEASAWSLTPVWYHLVFLVLLVPATLYGGRLRAHAPPQRVTVARADGSRKLA